MYFPLPLPQDRHVLLCERVQRQGRQRGRRVRRGLRRLLRHLQERVHQHGHRGETKKRENIQILGVKKGNIIFDRGFGEVEDWWVKGLLRHIEAWKYLFVVFVSPLAGNPYMMATCPLSIRLYASIPILNFLILFSPTSRTART